MRRDTLQMSGSIYLVDTIATRKSHFIAISTLNVDIEYIRVQVKFIILLKPNKLERGALIY